MVSSGTVRQEDYVSDLIQMSSMFSCIIPYGSLHFWVQICCSVMKEAESAVISLMTTI